MHERRGRGTISYKLLIKKAEEGIGRFLNPLQPLSLTPLNKKKFDFQGFPFGFSRRQNLDADNQEVQMHSFICAIT